jgi:FixJ family two-component response regulator
VSETNRGGAGSSAEAPIVAVVDDDPSVLRSLRSLLLSSGFRVQAFQSGAAFLASPELARIDCLILDVHMPGMSGWNVVSQLHTIRPIIPFIVLTATADHEVAARMMKEGAVACLRKPASGGELLGAVRTALRKCAPIV